MIELLDILQLFYDGWIVIFTNAVPFGLDGHTSCTKKEIILNTWEIWEHELHHAIYDCPDFLKGLKNGTVDFILRI